MGAIIVIMMSALALSVLVVVLFGKDEKIDVAVNVAGEPLAIEAPSCQRVEPRHTWDEVDQAWGEAQWMMVTG